MKFNTNYIYVVLSGIFFGCAVTGGKFLSNIGFSLFEILFIPSFIVLFIFMYHGIKEFKHIKKAPRNALIVFCLSVFLIQFGQYVPIFFNLSPSMISLLIYAQPLWTLGINRFYLKNKLKRYEVISALFVLLGMVVLLNPFSMNGKYTYSLLGILLALMAGIALSLWVVSSTTLTEKGHLTKKSLAFVQSVSGSFPFLIMFLLVKLFFNGNNLSKYFIFTFDKPLIHWIYIFIYSIIVFVFAAMFFYKGSEKVPSVHSGIILLIEPVIVVFLDYFFLGGTMTINIILGAMFIIGANAYLVIEGSMHERKLKEL